MKKIPFTTLCETRIELAREIAGKCPLEYGREIFIVGSVSRNLADEDSDIEIEFLTDSPIAEKELLLWIESIGGTDVYPYGAPLWDGSLWIIFRYKGHWIEAGWQTLPAMQKNVASFVEGQVVAHERLLLASVIKDALLVRDGGSIRGLQKQLAHYPSSLQKAILEATLVPWTIPLGMTVRGNLAKRDDKIPFLQRMIPDIERVFRILYALNKQWEPEWKWTHQIFRGLEIKPDNLEARVDAILCVTDPLRCLWCCFELIKDTLLLIPEELDVSDTVDKILQNIEAVSVVEATP